MTLYQARTLEIVSRDAESPSPGCVVRFPGHEGFAWFKSRESFKNTDLLVELAALRRLERAH